MADLHGTLVALTERTMGDEFEVAASAGATTLTLTDVSDFDEDGGRLTIAGTVYVYDSADMEADTVHLTTGLAASTAVGDRVDLWDFDTGDVVAERVALVSVNDQDGDPVSAVIDHSLTPLLIQATFAAGQSVTMTSDGDEYRLTAVHGKNQQATLRTNAATGMQMGVDDYAGNVYGITAAPGGTVVRAGTLGDFRVKTPDGATYMPILASAFTISSDPELKTTPTPAPDALSIIEAAPAFSWRYLSDDTKVQRVGPLADEVQAAAHWAAEVDTEDGGTLGLDLARMNGILWAAFGQQIEINQALEARIADLEKGAR